MDVRRLLPGDITPLVTRSAAANAKLRFVFINDAYMSSPNCRIELEEILRAPLDSYVVVPAIGFDPYRPGPPRELERDWAVTAVTPQSPPRELELDAKEAHLAPTPAGHDRMGALRRRLADAWNATSGLNWQAVGATRPLGGHELTNERLSAALQTRVTFTRAEWTEFGEWELQQDDYVESGGVYYTPASARVTEAIDFGTQMEAGWLLKELTRLGVLQRQLRMRLTDDDGQRMRR